MKKTLIKVFVLLFSTVALLGCSESDESVSYNENDLIGKWKLVDFNYSGELKLKSGGISSGDLSFIGVSKKIDITTTFSQNPNKVVSEGSYSLDISVNQNGEDSSKTYDLKDINNQAEWELNGDNLNVKNGKLIDINLDLDVTIIVGDNDGLGLFELDLSTAKVIELTDNSLKLKGSFEQEITKNGVTFVVKIDTSIYFSK